MNPVNSAPHHYEYKSHLLDVSPGMGRSRAGHGYHYLGEVRPGRRCKECGEVEKIIHGCM